MNDKANKVDVLGIMQAAAQFYSDEAEAQGQSGPVFEAIRVNQAIAAVAELIEADRYYDDAQFGLSRAKYNGEPVESWAQDVLKAEVRRAAALTRFGGA